MYKAFFVAVSVFGLCGSHAIAQPVVVHADSRADVTLPSRVVLHTNGDPVSVEVTVKRLDDASKVLETRPDKVGSVTRIDGQELDGLWVASDAANVGDNVESTIPVGVVLSPELTYSVQSDRRQMPVQGVGQSASGKRIVQLTAPATPVSYHIRLPEGSPAKVLNVPHVAVKDLDGVFRLRMTTIGPVTGDGDARLARPAYVPTRVQAEDGSLKLVEFENNTDHHVSKLQTYDLPSRIHELEDSRYSMSMGPGAVVTACFHSQDSPPYAPGYRRFVDEDMLRAHVDYRDSPPFSDRGSSYNLHLTNSSYASDPISSFIVGQTVDQVSQQLSSLLVGTTGLGRGEITSFPLGATSTIAETTFVPFSMSYSQYRGYLQVNSFIQDESLQEQNMYDSLPPGTDFPVLYGGFQERSDTIQLPRTMAGQFGRPVDSGFHFRIKINSSKNYRLAHFMPSSPSQIDLGYVIMHECLHGLGFDSNAADPNSAIMNIPRPNVAGMDLFRFPILTAGSFYSSADITNMRRDLTDTPARTPVLVTQVGTTAWFRMSRGNITDSYSPGHWAQESPCIGVMQGAYTQSCLRPGHLSLADQLALDIIGWNIDIDNAPLPPNPCLPTSPASGTTTSSLTPTLAWSGENTNARFFHVAIFQTDPVIGNVPVYYETYMPTTTTTITVPTGRLRAGQAYSWVVSSESDGGVAMSDIWTFTIASACRADFNADGGVTVQDIFDFLSAWFSGSFLADFNGSSDVTVQDIFDYLNEWFSGC